MRRATSRATSWMLRAILRIDVFGQHRFFQAQPTEPAGGQIEMDFLTQASFGRNPEAVTDDQHTDHQFRINRRPPDGTVERFHVLPDGAQVEKVMNIPEQMTLRHIIFDAEGLEQLLTACCLTTDHGKASSKTMP
jgi:hypothetical protein